VAGDCLAVESANSGLVVWGLVVDWSSPFRFTVVVVSANGGLVVRALVADWSPPVDAVANCDRVDGSHDTGGMIPRLRRVLLVVAPGRPPLDVEADG